MKLARERLCLRSAHMDREKKLALKHRCNAVLVHLKCSSVERKGEHPLASCGNNIGRANVRDQLLLDFELFRGVVRADRLPKEEGSVPPRSASLVREMH